MTANVSNGAESPPGDVRHPVVRPPSFTRQFLRLAGAYWSSEDRFKVWSLTMLLAGLTVAQVVVPVMINGWSQRLFDALEQHSMDRFMVQIGALSIILVASMTVTATHLAVKRRMQLGWRRWLTRRLLDDWMDAGRHFQVKFMPGHHDNPDGRIAEDIRNVTESAIDLAHSFVYCVLLLASFAQILWSLSGDLPVEILGLQLNIPGHMVWVAMLYATAGTGAALLLGRPLVRAVDKRQTVEANFRFGLVRARENSEAIALVHGEGDERRRLTDLFRGIQYGWNFQTGALIKIFLFTSGYSVLSTAFPVIVAAPRYIAGAITLGVLMQTAQAFQQMAAALSWPIDNLAKGAEWRASVDRVLGLHDALQDLKEDVSHVDRHTIAVETSTGPVLAFRDLAVANPDGMAVVVGFDAEIGLGERVLISGDPRAAVKLFKVVARLWPWGQGRVELPAGASIFFMPQRPYLPIGTLRDAISYPSPPDGFDDETLGSVLDRVGLAHQVHRLDESDAWEQRLTAGDQQRLGFARLLLHRPNWIFIQEATDTLDGDSEEDMMRLVQEEFEGATIITVGYRPALEAYHQRKLTLVRNTDGLVMIKETRLRREAARSQASPQKWHHKLLGMLKKK